MKPKIIFKGPVTTASGYGVHSRQLLGALVRSERYDISVSAISWGQTPFIQDDTGPMRTIKRLMSKYEEERSGDSRYDISVQVTIPNEFSRLADANVGVTAGIEVDRASPKWIQAINEHVDVLVVPSHHSAATIARVAYRGPDGQELRCTKPVAVLAEGIDTSIFNVDAPDPADILDLTEVTSEFNFLFVGLGLDKGMGEDRKNVSTLIRWFGETFRDDSGVGLILKLGLVNHSILDFEMTKRKIGEIKRAHGLTSPVHLLHGRLTDRQLAGLYKHPKVKAFVSLTHGEGFGLPLIEAAACGLPVVATAWSGHLDFLQIEGKRRFVPIEHDLAEIPPAAVWDGVMEPGSRWAMPREVDAKAKMRKIVLSYGKPKEWASELAAHVATNYDEVALGAQFCDFVDHILSQSAAHRSRSPRDIATVARERLGILPGERTLLYTMPMSAGDVFVSTAVVSGLKEKFPDHKIFFATQPEYASLLDENPDVHRVIKFEPWMQDVPLCELIFTEVYTPNLAIQNVSSNWVHGGKGRRLADEMAAQCHVPLGEYRISSQAIEGLPEKYIAFHPGSGKGQWEARNYHHWQEVVENIGRICGLAVVQVGLPDDPLYSGVVDLRGKTTYRQLAYVIDNSECLVSIDSVAMHMAAVKLIPHVALFGSSYASSTGPVFRERLDPPLSVLLETPDRGPCEKACYKHQCSVDRDRPCINNVSPRSVVASVIQLIGGLSAQQRSLDELEYREHRPRISGYTTVLDGISAGYPFVESIISMTAFCDEVVVVDGGSRDGTLERLRELSRQHLNVQLIERAWDWSEPGMDGMQKAFARAMCTHEFLWQQDADEVVHEDDYGKIRELVRSFPRSTNLLHLPVVELWGGGGMFRTDRHPWKWRLSRNDFNITHGINKAARTVDEKTGRTYAKRGMSDGCEYVDIMTGEHIPHSGFYTNELELLRRRDPIGYGSRMNEIFGTLPSVYHYSWANIPRKIRNFRDFWDRCWSNLHGDVERARRFFPGREPSSVTDDEIVLEALAVTARGGEHGPGTPVPLARANPAIMDGWLRGIIDEFKPKESDAAGRHLRDDLRATVPPGEVPRVAAP